MKLKGREGVQIISALLMNTAIEDKDEVWIYSHADWTRLQVYSRRANTDSFRDWNQVWPYWLIETENLADLDLYIGARERLTSAHTILGGSSQATFPMQSRTSSSFTRLVRIQNGE